MDQDSRPKPAFSQPPATLDLQSLLQTVIDAAAEHVILFDHQGTILAANRKARDLWEPLLGGSMLGRHGLELGPPELVAQRGKLCEQVVRTARPARFCDVHDGREIEHVIYPVPDSAGEVRRVVAFSQDVSRYRQSQRQVQTRDAMLGALVDTIPDPIFYKDAAGRYLGCNAAFAERLGASREEIIGKTVKEAWSPEEAEVFATMDAELLQAGGTQRYDTQVRNAAGELRDVLFTKATFARPDGTIGGIIGVMTDITDRKRRESELREIRNRLEQKVDEQTRNLQETNNALRREVQERMRAEEALRASQQFIEAALDSLDDPFFAKDEQHRWVLLNRKSCELMGRPREELIGKTDYDLFPPEEADVFWQNDLRAFEAGRLVEEEQITWHGEKHHISTSKNVYEEPESGRRFLVGTIRDITDRIEAENRLRLSEQRLRAILAATPDLVFVIDAEGYYVDIFTSESPFLVKPAQELIGRNFRDVLPPDLAKQCEEALRKALQTDVSQTMEHELTGLDGKVRWAQASVMRFVYQGQDHAVIAERDITERVEAENRLRLSEQRLRAILTSSPDVMFVLDSNGRYVDVFTAKTQLLALPADELLGRTIHDVLPASIAGPAQEVVDAVLESGQARKHEYAIDLYTGERRWFSASVAKFAHEGNDRVVWAARDITDRVLAEQAARQAEARFREVLDHSQAILFRFDMKEGRCEYLSRSAGATTGHPAEKLESWTVDQHLATFHPDDLKRLKAGMADTPDQLPGQKNVVAEFRRRGADGEYLWFADWSTYFYDKEGELEAIVGSAYDITDRKIVEQELRHARDELEQRVAERTAELAASEERWRSIVETAPNIIWFIDREGKIRYVNQRPSGKPIEDAIGSPVDEHFVPRHRQTVRHALQRTLRQEEISYCEVEGAVDGKPAGWFSMRLGPVRRGDQIVGATLVAADITARKQAEAALHTAQQQLMTAQETERRRLASDLHDSVSQMLFALQMKLKHLHSTCAACDRQDELGSAVEQVNHLIQETRAIYRGLYPPGLVQLGLAAALKQLVHSFQGPVTVNLDFDPTAREARLGDEVEIALFRVAQEAIRNAVAHSGTEVIDVSLEYARGQVVLEIGDYGSGFDPSAVSGLSLGLSTMRERAESIGGTIEIDTGARGTSVRVNVPLNVSGE